MTFEQLAAKIKNPEYREWFENYLEGSREEIDSADMAVEYLLAGISLEMDDVEEVKTVADIEEWHSYLGQVIEVIKDIKE